jgi:hypothetical protein
MVDRYRDDVEFRALIRIALVAGFIAMAAYPVSMTYSPAAFSFLALPIALAASGRIRQQHAVEVAGLVLAGLVVVAFTGRVPFLLDAIVLAGPVALLWFVGGAIRLVDHRIATLWVIASAVAFVGGLLLTTGAPNAAISLVALASVPAVIIPLLRLRRRRLEVAQ